MYHFLEVINARYYKAIVIILLLRKTAVSQVGVLPTPGSYTAPVPQLWR